MLFSEKSQFWRRTLEIHQDPSHHVSSARIRVPVPCTQIYSSLTCTGLQESCLLRSLQQSFCLINPHLTGIFNNPRLQPLLLHRLLTDLHEINYLRPSSRALQLCHPWKLLSPRASRTRFILHLISSHQPSILQLSRFCHSLSYASIVACLTVRA